MAVKKIEDKAWKELSKRRVFLFFSVFFLFAMLGDTFNEADKINHAVDEIATVILSLAAVTLILTQRNKRSFIELKSQNNTLAMLVVLMIVAGLYAIAIEAGTDDFADEIPVMIGLIIMLANRFV